MATLKTTLNLGRIHSGWGFWLLWYAATFIGMVLYFIPVGVVHMVLGLDRLEDPLRSGEVTPWMLVLAAVLCGAACGSTIGLAQWLVLRRRLQRVGWWVGATIAGYASIGLLPLIASVFQPGWLNWAFTLIINGKMHWLARVEAAWPAASWPAGAITLTMFGAVLGIMQWLVLRGHLYRAGWWIAISAGGWALAAALSIVTDDLIVVLATSDVPALVTGAGMVWLQRRSAVAGQPSR
jgi:hypothetical protein